jgi:CDP-diacylglycerol--glycerol-3-phosphate 3-phosphatidyltransferase
VARTVPYDASARLTPANVVTVGRLVVSPVLIALILADGPSYPALLLGFVIAITDGFDGWLARRYGATRSGAFLDPLADKVLVLGAMVTLVFAGVFWWLPVTIIAAREVIISAFRSFWGRRGLAVPATQWAKVKTVVQEVAVGFALLPLSASHRWIANTTLWIAVVLTITTGIHYVHAGSRATRTTGS